MTRRSPGFATRSASTLVEDAPLGAASAGSSSRRQRRAARGSCSPRPPTSGSATRSARRRAGASAISCETDDFARDHAAMKRARRALSRRSPRHEALWNRRGLRRSLGRPLGSAAAGRTRRAEAGAMSLERQILRLGRRARGARLSAAPARRRGRRRSPPASRSAICSIRSCGACSASASAASPPRCSSWSCSSSSLSLLLVIARADPRRPAHRLHPETAGLRRCGCRRSRSTEGSALLDRYGGAWRDSFGLGNPLSAEQIQKSVGDFVAQGAQWLLERAAVARLRRRGDLQLPLAADRHAGRRLLHAASTGTR